MSRLVRAHLAVLCALTLAAGLAHGEKPFQKFKDKVKDRLKEKLKDKLPVPAILTYRISEPIVQDNLTIFFLFGENQIKGKTILTLDEALATKKVIVHETRNVNELAIENVSDVEVFIQAGDIVKGGQQDRTIAVDVLVKPRSGRLAVSSFCVEQGRWAARGSEDVSRFSRSYGVIVGNELKLKARAAKSQGAVWREVTVAQGKLARALKSEVMDPRSATSLQLTLEHKKVQEAIDGHVRKLEKELPSVKEGNVIGYAVAINGKVMSADVYASSDLFRRLWPKLLRASVIEAVSEKSDREIRLPRVPREAVTVFLAASAFAKMTERKVTLDLREVQKETLKQVLFESRTAAGAVLRRSYIAK